MAVDDEGYPAERGRVRRRFGGSSQCELPCIEGPETRYHDAIVAEFTTKVIIWSLANPETKREYRKEPVSRSARLRQHRYPNGLITLSVQSSAPRTSRVEGSG